MRFIGVAAIVCLAVGFSACGSSTATLSSNGVSSPSSQPQTCATRGGTLVSLQETDFEHLDPGIAYASLEYASVFATQRPLYSNKPNSVEPTPDLAESMPVISEGGKLVTVHIRHGIHFSPPVNREVTSADVAYAMDRGANPNVATPYFEAYFSAIEGAPQATGGPIPGIRTPNPYTIVFKLTRPLGQLVADALVLPVTAPVPKEYALKYDEQKPSKYSDYMVATGPYMFKNNAEGKVLGIGYIVGQSATLVRNPNWNPKTDFRPACLNEIQIKIGGDATVLAEQTVAGKNIVFQEATPSSVLRQAYEHHRNQLEIAPAGIEHYIGVNNSSGPFQNEDLRKALYVALDRNALNKLAGGSLVASNATHMIYPTIPGFEQAGGYKGPQGSQFDFNQHFEGDPQLAAEYIKKAGYPSGKYTGGGTVTIVASTTPSQRGQAEIVNQTLNSLGFQTKLSEVEKPAMYSKYCGVPKEKITICPSVEWGADFADPQTILNVTFNGKFIKPEGSVNFSLTNYPWLNSEMTKGEEILGNQQRAEYWAKLDDQVIEHAMAIPFEWSKPALVAGSTVQGVGQLWNAGTWDYSYTSLK